MANFNGSQHDLLLEKGLADAEDPEDFQIKSANVGTVWESLVPAIMDKSSWDTPRGLFR